LNIPVLSRPSSPSFEEAEFGLELGFDKIFGFGRFLCSMNKLSS